MQNWLKNMLIEENVLRFAGRYILLLIVYSFLSANLHLPAAELFATALAVAVASRFAKFSLKGVFSAFVCFAWIPPLFLYLLVFFKGVDASSSGSGLMAQGWLRLVLILCQPFWAALTLLAFSYIEHCVMGSASKSQADKRA